MRPDGIAKIIDLGFGKHVAAQQDFDKSVTLNWWCAPPDEFTNQIYDFRTEVYFVGKLFQELITDLSISDFRYKRALAAMCHASPEDRIASFSLTRQAMLRSQINKGEGDEFEFSEHDLSVYRLFSEQLKHHISKIENKIKYVDDPKRIISALEDAFRACMLEELAPTSAPILRAFLSGNYYYKKSGFPVATLKSFLEFFKGCNYERQRIVLANLHAKFDSLERYWDADDEIPF